MRIWVPVAVIVFAFLLWVLRGVLAPFAAAFIVAYIAEPLVRPLSLRVGRASAAALVIFGSGSLLLLLLVMTLPAVLAQAGSLLADLPQAWLRLQQELRENLGREGTDLLQSLNPEVLRLNPDDVSKHFFALSGLAGSAVGSVVRNTTGFAESLLFILLTPVIAFYLSVDFDRFLKAVENWVPRRYLASFCTAFGDIDRILSSYMRGQLMVCAVQSIYYSMALALCGIPYALFIGVFSGIMTVVPYVGASLGWFIAALAAFVSGLPLAAQGMIIGVYVLGQIMEGYLLVPYLVGRSVGLHPLWVMMGLAVLGYLMGFTGLLLALPLTAACAVPVRMLRDRYVAGDYYQKK